MAVMAKLPKVGKVEIKVRGNDHLPPHFHVVGPDFDAQVEIATLRVLKGSLPKRAAWCWSGPPPTARSWSPSGTCATPTSR